MHTTRPGFAPAVTTVLIATTACADTTAPTAPTSLAATSVTTTGLTLSWSAATDNVGVTKYEVSRNGTLVASPTTTSSSQTGLSCGTTYAFVVLAVDAAGNRSTPAQLSASTTACADTTAPTAPTNLTATSVTTTGLTLSWSAATDNVGVTKYEVSRNGTLVASPTTTSSSQTGLSCGTTYAFAVLAVDAAGNRSTPAQLSRSTAACTTGPAPTLQPIDGGTSYFGQFTNAASMDASSYFPIAVWGAYNQTQANRDLDAAAGINTYVWVADDSYMDDIRADGRFRVIQDQTQNRSAVGAETAGWVLADEIDMQQANASGAAAARSQLSSIVAGLPSDGRLRYTNYGKGVIFWNSDSDAEQYVNDFQQLVSTDVYWFTEGDVCSQYQGGNLLGLGRDLTSAECHRASNYGAQVARVRALDAMDGKRMPVWSFVETGHPFDNNMGGARSIAPAEIRAAVWHSIIAGARGIIYFQHSFGGSCVGDHHTIRSNCEGTRPVVVVR